MWMKDELNAHSNDVSSTQTEAPKTQNARTQHFTNNTMGCLLYHTLLCKATFRFQGSFAQSSVCHCHRKVPRCLQSEMCSRILPLQTPDSICFNSSVVSLTFAKISLKELFLNVQSGLIPNGCETLSSRLSTESFKTTQACLSSMRLRKERHLVHNIKPCCSVL
jgi:hypothetical protein